MTLPRFSGCGIAGLAGVAGAVGSAVWWPEGWPGWIRISLACAVAAALAAAFLAAVAAFMFRMTIEARLSLLQLADESSRVDAVRKDRTRMVSGTPMRALDLERYRALARVPPEPPESS